MVSFLSILYNGFRSHQRYYRLNKRARDTVKRAGAVGDDNNPTSSSQPRHPATRDGTESNCWNMNKRANCAHTVA